MKLAEALRILHEDVPAGADSRRVVLVCGFMPLHLQTFLAAHLRSRLPGVAVEIKVGLFGDLLGNLQRALQQETDAVAVVVEWSDLDPRLGIRDGGGWSSDGLADIVTSVETKIEHLRGAIAQLLAHTRVVLCLPTLPMPPAGYTSTLEWSPFELTLRARTLDLGRWCAGMARASVLSGQQIDMLSPLAERFDVNSEFRAGFPYRRPHAEIIGRQLARDLFPESPKKGLITDLDDTLWRGILGEVGRSGVTWDAESGSRTHALYQRLLASLADNGVLIGVASKNNAKLVQQALSRPDLLIDAERLFPVEANWGPKSASIARILSQWNISADAAVFVDDAEIELDEVRREHDGITCLRFHKEDPEACWKLVHHLRDLFGKPDLTPEDQIRARSLRSAAALSEASGDGPKALESFLADAGASIVVDASKPKDDARSFQLVNKTNQFNLNGRRLLESEWSRYLNADDAFVTSFSYEDKYGPLGKIAVVAGVVADTQVSLEAWVMSCRAFGRHIEYQCLRWLFDRYGASELLLRYRPTERNEPMRELLANFGVVVDGSNMILAREVFDAGCPQLHHTVRETERCPH